MNAINSAINSTCSTDVEDLESDEELISSHVVSDSSDENNVANYVNNDQMWYLQWGEDIINVSDIVIALMYGSILSGLITALIYVIVFIE